MSKSLSLVIEDDGFATIRMNNGENRFQLRTLTEWHKTLDKVIASTETRALFITGEGRFFSNGIDLQWLSQQTGDTRREFMDMLYNVVKCLLVLPIPTVSLINGHAFGVGAFIAIACDFRVMRPDKGWLCWPETAIDLRFGDRLLKLAKAKIPPGVAQRDTLLFAKRLTGNEAKRLGLVDEVVEESKMTDCAKKLVTEVLGKTGLNRKSVQATKNDMYGHEHDLSKL